MQLKNHSKKIYIKSLANIFTTLIYQLIELNNTVFIVITVSQLHKKVGVSQLLCECHQFERVSINSVEYRSTKSRDLII